MGRSTMKPSTVSQNLADQIAWLQEHGSSLVLNWGEDGWWEASWIAGGERFTKTAKLLDQAIATLLPGESEEWADYRQRQGKAPRPS